MYILFVIWVPKDDAAETSDEEKRSSREVLNAKRNQSEG
jgi:hypothetical protein